MKKWKKILFLFGIIIIFYMVFMRAKYPVVDNLPVVMQKDYGVVVDEKMKSVYLEKDGKEQNIGISIGNDKTLYIANAVGHNITKFDIKNEKNEIYIRKNIIDYKHGNNDKFQLIKVPYNKYRDILNNNILYVYIEYVPNGHELREYNVISGQYKTLEQTDTTK